ncbi:hypothetical protein EJB05_47932, partial [Eragrostis curvula]
MPPAQALSSRHGLRGDEVAEDVKGRALRVLGNESYMSHSSIVVGAPGRKVAAPTSEGFEFEGMVFAVTESNEVAEVLDGGAVRVLGSESVFDEGTGTREHFVDVQGKTEAMLLLVSVREDQRRIVGILRCS